MRTHSKGQKEVTPFWTFSLSFYGRSSVAPACLDLQDGSGADVNILLFMLWMASRSRSLSTKELVDMSAATREWRETVILPLRSARRSLKSARLDVEPSETDALRAQVKAAELDAERVEQNFLYRRYPHEAFGTPTPSPEDAAAANFRAYEEGLDTTFPAGAVRALLDAFSSHDRAGSPLSTDTNETA